MDIDGYALVAGGGSGIGRASALAFAQEGAAGLLIADLNLAAAEQTALDSRAVAANPSYRVLATRLDVTDEASVAAGVDLAVKAFGRIDYAVNCAGIGTETAADVSTATTSDYVRMMNVNVAGIFNVTRALSAVMKTQEPRSSARGSKKRGGERGSIVNLGSCASLAPSPGTVLYTTSKHAALGLTKSAALDNAPHGIRVNCLCPSWVDTPMIRRAMEGMPDLDHIINTAVALGRIAEPEEISDAIIFLSSPRASYITGTAFLVDGGTTLTLKI